MALSSSQTDLYQMRVTLWRATESIAADGTPSYSWSAVTSAVPCYFENRNSMQTPVDGARVESENSQTTDTVHFEASVDVRAGDVLKQTTGPDSGDFWTVRGNPKIKSLLANKLTVEATRELKAPDGVS